MAVSKHFGGAVPVSAVCATAEAADRAVANGYFATRSHATDPMLCAAGSASIEVIVEERLPERAARIGDRIKAAFVEMAREFELVGDIRGRGVLLGIELVADRESRVPVDAAAKAMLEHCERSGLILQLRGSGGHRNVLRLVPPMSTSDDDVDRALDILRDGIAKAITAAGE